MMTHEQAQQLASRSKSLREILRLVAAKAGPIPDPDWARQVETFIVYLWSSGALICMNEEQRNSDELTIGRSRRQVKHLMQRLQQCDVGSHVGVSLARARSLRQSLTWLLTVAEDHPDLLH